MRFDKNDILEAAGGEISIYQRYLPGLTNDHITGRRKNINSCFSKDSNPSLSIYKRNERLLFKCHSTGNQGNVFEFFALNEGINTKDFPAILKAMNEKLKLGLNAANTSPVRSEKWSAEYYPDFTDDAKAFWARFGINSEILTHYQVRQLILLTYNGENGLRQFRFAETGRIAFEYRVNGRYKLYLPKQEGLDQKYFIKTQTNDDIFGLAQLPSKKVPVLLICEGEKDALCANAHGIPAVSFQSANTEVQVHHIRKLYEHACDLVICYDMDEPGIKASKKLSRIHLIPRFELEENVYKDLAEYLPGRDVEKFKDKLNDCIRKFKRSNNMGITERYGQYWAIRKEQNDEQDNPEQKPETRGEIAVTNFTLEVDAFVSSSVESKRIIRIRDAATGKVTEPFSVHTDQFISVDQFRKLLESKGNFFFSGSPYDLLAIKKHCFRQAAMAEEVPHLGFYEHQGKTSFVLSNAVWLDGRWQYPDKFGIVEGMQIPSAALENRYQDVFKTSRTFKYEPNEGVTVADWIRDLSDCFEVFPAIAGFAFIFATLYFDHISSKRSAFPLLLIWGQKGSGKNSFVEMLLALFGTAIKHDASLANATGNSLNKLHEQRANIPVWMDEFKNNLDIRGGVVERLKGLFDLVGRSKAVDSSNRTKSSQIKTSTIVSGQEFPTDEALLSRCIVMEFQVRENSAESRTRFTEAKARCSSGLGHLIPQLISYRMAIQQEFQAEFVKVSSALTSYLNDMDIQVNSRLIDNYACILAPLVIGLRHGLKLYPNQSNWENEYADLIKMFAGAVESQSKVESKMDEVMMFWECFINMAGKHIFYGHDFVIQRGKLGFKSKVLDEYQKYFRSIHGKDGPNKDAVIKYMAKRKYFEKNSTDGRLTFNNKQERCYICNLDLMPAGIKEDLLAFSFPVPLSGA